jgi:competence protein ComEA
VPNLARSQLVFYTAVALAVLLLGVRALRATRPSAAPPVAAVGETPPARAIRLARAAPRRVVVHVVGAVRRPGLYRLTEAARVADAVRRAGGARAGADLVALNLAAPLADGQQIVVPVRRDVGGAVVAPGVTAAAGAGAGARSTGAPIDLNTATAEQLDQLDGVGPVTAQKILAWRREHGAFRSSDQLADIPGIGPKRLAALRPQVRP